MFIQVRGSWIKKVIQKSPQEPRNDKQNSRGRRSYPTPAAPTISCCGSVANGPPRRARCGPDRRRPPRTTFATFLPRPYPAETPGRGRDAENPHPDQSVQHARHAGRGVARPSGATVEPSCGPTPPGPAGHPPHRGGGKASHLSLPFMGRVARRAGWGRAARSRLSRSRLTDQRDQVVAAERPVQVRPYARRYQATPGRNFHSASVLFCLCCRVRRFSMRGSDALALLGACVVVAGCASPAGISSKMHAGEKPGSDPLCQVRQVGGSRLRFDETTVIQMRVANDRACAWGVSLSGFSGTLGFGIARHGRAWLNTRGGSVVYEYKSYPGYVGSDEFGFTLIRGDGFFNPVRIEVTVVSSS